MASGNWRRVSRVAWSGDSNRMVPPAPVTARAPTNMPWRKIRWTLVVLLLLGTIGWAYYAHPEMFSAIYDSVAGVLRSPQIQNLLQPEWYPWWGAAAAIILLLFLIRILAKHNVFRWESFGHRGVSMLMFLVFVGLIITIYSLFGFDLIFWYKARPQAMIATGLFALLIAFSPRGWMVKWAFIAQIAILILAGFQMNGYLSGCAVDPKTGLSPCAYGDDGQLHFGDYKEGDVLGGSGESANVRILKPHATADDVNRITTTEQAKPAQSGYGYWPQNPGANLVKGLKSLTEPVIIGPSEVTWQTPEITTGVLKVGEQKRFCFQPNLSVKWDSNPVTAVWEIGVERFTATGQQWFPWWKAKPWTHGEGKDTRCLTFKYAKSPINTAPSAEMNIHVRRS